MSGGVIAIDGGCRTNPAHRILVVPSKQSPCWRRGEVGRVGTPETLTAAPVRSISAPAGTCWSIGTTRLVCATASTGCDRPDDSGLAIAMPRMQSSATVPTGPWLSRGSDHGARSPGIEPRPVEGTAKRTLLLARAQQARRRKRKSRADLPGRRLWRISTALIGAPSPAARPSPLFSANKWSAPSDETRSKITPLASGSQRTSASAARLLSRLRPLGAGERFGDEDGARRAGGGRVVCYETSRAALAAP